MKKITAIIVSAYLCAFSQEVLDADGAQEILNENAEEKAVVSKKPKNKTAPIISLNKREIAISAAGVKEMKITVFSVNGRKLAAKNVIGGNTAFLLPKSAKNAVIVQIDADKKFFSQKVFLE